MAFSNPIFDTLAFPKGSAVSETDHDHSQSCSSNLGGGWLVIVFCPNPRPDRGIN